MVNVTPVRGSGFEVNSLIVETDSGEAHETRQLAVSTGGKAFIPPVFESSLGDRVFHSKDYLARIPDQEDLNGTIVAVIGSGQSAAEIVYHLASTSDSKVGGSFVNFKVKLISFSET